ncbi:hypothetical protein [Chryseobacterium flavum]|uniref:hypothetical protein n=1 Tax=Chryseobacterium flavum TaxID=415851 RepID=UPI0028AFFC2C|nr:hypothetical protein [Chryseobacterium flavum]
MSHWFLGGLLVWVMIIIFRRNQIYIPLINDHLTDLITIPMYCYLIEYIINNIPGFKYNWKPDLKFVLISVIYISFLFEVICPELSENFTGDIFDVFSYFIGGTAYYYFRNTFFFSGNKKSADTDS